MSTYEERQRDNIKRDELINECCGGDKSAQEYIHILCAALRVWDDVYDQDYPVTPTDITDTYKMLFISLPSNKFFRDNYDLLFSQHVVLYNQWVASNRWLDGDNLEQMYAHFYKEGLNEIVPLVALITQGEKKMEEISFKLRDNFKSKIGG